MNRSMASAALVLAVIAAPRAAQDPQPPPQNQEKPAPTMTGTWALEVQHSAGVSTPTVTITQTGEKLTGQYAGSYGESELTGSIKGACAVADVRAALDPTSPAGVAVS